MKLVGQMSISGRFPLWASTLKALESLVDELYVRVQGDALTPLEFLVRDVCDKSVTVLSSDLAWNPWNWREEMVRMLDPVKPDMVLSLDQCRP